MLIYSILYLLLSNAVTLRRDKSILFSRVVIIVLLNSSLLAVFNLFIIYFFTGIGLSAGILHSTVITLIFHIFIFLVSAVILQLTTFYHIRVRILIDSYLYSNHILFDVYRAFTTARVTFMPYNIFKYFVSLVFVGIISDLFICLPYKPQMSILIILLGIIVEIYDNKRLKIKLFIEGVIKNKTYNFTVFILRLLGFYLIITFLISMLPLDIFIINSYILPYLQVSLVKKLLFFSFLGEIFSNILLIAFDFIPYAKCDSLNDWHRFVRSNPTVIMPPKFESLSALAPEIDKSKTLLWIYNNKYWASYYWNHYHPNDLKVYGQRSLRSEFRIVDAHPLPQCDGFYIRVVEQLGSRVTFRALDTNNSHMALKPLYVRTTNGEYILTPFKLQRGFKKFNN